MKKHKAVINVSPLCDVCFTVLMTLMVTVPIIAIAGKIKVDLPAAHIKEQRDEAAICVTITPKGEVAIGEVEIGRITGEEGNTTIQKFLDRLKEQIQEDPERMVMIRADRMVLHGMVLDLLRTSKLFGAKKIAIAALQAAGG